MDVYSWFRSRKTSAIRSEKIINNKGSKEEEEFLGVTTQLIDLIKSFNLDTFKNFPLPDEEVGNCADNGTSSESGKAQKDLSDWQERHATLVLSKVKELSQIRFRLCPGYLKERDFWRIYFTLVKSILAEYELNAIRLEKLKEMKVENEIVKKASACEVEMLETKPMPIANSENL